MAKDSYFQIGSITIEKEKYNGSTREFTLTWDGHLDANAKGTFVGPAQYFKNISAITTYTISYNVNGGSGTIASQTKTHGVTLVLTTSKPTRTGYTFVSWNTKQDGTGTSYASGSNFTTNAQTILYAKWTPVTYAVSYNKNTSDTVTSIPANQTKIYNTTLKLSSTRPNRANYNFIAWYPNSGGTGNVSYAPGSNYTGNATLTLYAKWEEAYIPPLINNLTAYRVDTSGNQDNEGTYSRVDFIWGAGSRGGVAVSPTQVRIKWKKITDSTYSNSIVNSIANNTVSIVIGSTSLLDTDSQYDIEVSLLDNNNEVLVTRTTYISVSSFIIDINTEGNAIGIGMAAPDGVSENQLWIDANMYLKKDLLLEKTDPRLRVRTFDANNAIVADG